ncbi:MAG: CbiX/SirB N-terminal domain-containing protein [Aquisalimonadaceae bacterium]
MRHLLIIAHGSRREASNEEVRRLAERFAVRAGERFQRVCCAFLELAEPSIPEAVDACVADGAAEIVILPYFLSAGRHVTKDIPEQLLPGREQYPHVRIHVLPYVGAEDGMLDLMLGMAEAKY